MSITDLKRFVVNAGGHKFVNIIELNQLALIVKVVRFANTIKEEYIVYLAEDLKFVFIKLINVCAKSVTEAYFVKRLFVKLIKTQKKSMLVYVLDASFIRTPTDQTHATTRPRNAPWSMSC